MFQGNNSDKSKERFANLFIELEDYRLEKEDFMLIYGNTLEQLHGMVYVSSAILHSIVGIKVSNEMLRTSNILGSSSLMIAVSLIVIYGGYFYATYVGFKNIVKSASTMR